VPRPLAPEVQVGQSVAVCLDRVSHFLGHTPIRTHVQQDCASVSNQAKRPVCDNARANDAHDRIYEDPAEELARRQASDRQHRDHGREHMYERRTHVVVPMPVVVIFVLVNWTAAAPLAVGTTILSFVI